jgi:hypothetical protein
VDPFLLRAAVTRKVQLSKEALQQKLHRHTHKRPSVLIGFQLDANLDAALHESPEHFRFGLVKPLAFNRKTLLPKDREVATYCWGHD